ncbi:MAG: 50S ribosomal protein L32 [Clostridia bacterium]|nr:50S ribosomal protein L32 [Clostridia bacterium]
MAQPKRRWSKARTHTKRSTWTLKAKNLVECPHCHELMEQHKVCPACGYYDGEKVINVQSDNNEE